MIKHLTVLTLTACTLCACGGNYLTKENKALQDQDAFTMCTALAASNQADLERIRTQYGTKAAEMTEPLFTQLNQETNAVCRSRIARQAQNERIEELRATYRTKINEAVRAALK